VASDRTAHQICSASERGVYESTALSRGDVLCIAHGCLMLTSSVPFVCASRNASLLSVRLPPVTIMWHIPAPLARSMTASKSSAMLLPRARSYWLVAFAASAGRDL
jgi:hypothetical protein